MIKNLLLENLEQIHTTELGAKRIQKNLSIQVDDVVAWCCEKIQLESAIISKKGKNWYVRVEHCIITVNASSYTIITAHKEK